MLKDKIVKLCDREKITIKRLSIEIEVSEPTLYRWFRDDSLEIKYLRKIADYFGVELNYFFASESEPKAYPHDIKSNIEAEDPKTEYVSVIKDKYIKVLEENIMLQKQVADLRCELQECQAKLTNAETKQPV